MDAPHLLARARMRLGDSDSIGSHDGPAALCAVSKGESQEASAPGEVLLSSWRYICFGPFCVDQRKQEVSRGGARIKLQGKVYQALLALLEKPCEVVTREELRMRLWPDDTHVNYDANVNTAVNKLRRALEDSSEEPAYIETISKKGYRLLVQPEVSGMLGNHQLRNEGPSDGAEVSSQAIAVSGFSKSELWMVLGAIGLILAGMILGAGLMNLWIHHGLRLDLNHEPKSVRFFDTPEQCEIDGALQNLEVSNERLPIGVS